MNFLKEIKALAKAYKSQLYGFFYGVDDHLSVELKLFYLHQLNALCILAMDSPYDLCKIVKEPFQMLEKLINEPKYRHSTIPKKKGGFREIYAPGKRLKRTQKCLNYFLQAHYLWIRPKEVHGFVINPHYKGPYCNIAENARAHIGKKHVLNIDLKDFFPSITARQVKALFLSPYFDYDEQMATALTLLTTFEGKLPTGAPTSPVISNFICLQLDKDIIDFCLSNNLTYTRYADDLTFSSDAKISDDEILDLINIIHKNKFRINGKKLYLRTSNQRQVVTGLTVNEKVNVDRKLLKQIRAMSHDLSRNGLEAATAKHFKIRSDCSAKDQSKFIDRLQGYINFVGQIRGKEDPVFLRMKKETIEAVKVNLSKTPR